MIPDCPLPPGSRIYFYVRHSPGYTQDAESQINAGKVYCEQYGLVIAHIFVDVARPGWTIAGRDEFQLMIGAADQEPRPVDGIAFWDYSRFSRDIDDAPYFRAMLRRKGYVVFSITEKIPDDPLMARVYEAFIDFDNARDKEKRSRSIMRGLHDRVNEGYSAGGRPPIGYLAEVEQIGWKTGGAPKLRTRWIPDPARFHLAQKAWEMRAGGATYPEIHRAIPFYSSPRCWSWFFRNETYRGYRLCGSIKIPDAHPAACTEEQWQQVQAMRQSCGKGGAYPRRASSSFLLSSLLVCRTCGNPVSGSVSGPRQHRWRHYLCSVKTNRKYDRCPSRPISAARVDQAVVRTVLDEILTPQRFLESVEAINEKLAAGQNGLSGEIECKRAELDRANKVVHNLGYAIAYGSLSLTPELVKEEMTQARLKTELEQLEKLASQQRLVIDEFTIAAKLEQMRTDLAGFTGGDVTNTRKFLQSFISRIVMGADGGVIHYHIPMLTSNQASSLLGLVPSQCVTFAY